MAPERTRAPVGVRSHLSVAFSADATPLADLFGQAPYDVALKPHPDFAARAAIWRDHAAGLISLAEAQRRSAAVGLALDLKQDGISPHGMEKPRSVRPRHSRPAPNASRQYAGEMATTAARDDRLTPGARAFLQVLRARCGKGRATEFAKATLAAVMSRSPRTIRRYLVDLVQFGYVATEIRRTGRGLHTGLVVTLSDKVLPFYEEAKGLAAWLAETPKMLDTAFIGRVLGKQGVTVLTPKNQTPIFFPFGSRKAAKNGRWGVDQRPPSTVSA